jgi:hypothetical protein
MFKKIYAQVQEYETTLTKQDFDSDPLKIQTEIDKIQKDFTADKAIAVNITFENKKYTLDQFIKLLKQQKSDLEEKKSIKKEYDSFLFHNIGGKNVDVSTEEGQDQIKRQMAAIDKQIQIQEETLAQIDNYVVTLLTGEMANLNIAHTNSKFIKIADQPTEEEVLKPVEEYFNNLYDDTPGSPNMGKLYTHPEKHRNELSTEAQVGNSKPKFKKK